jgi:hypothetical protein
LELNEIGELGSRIDFGCSLEIYGVLEPPVVFLEHV